MEVESARPPSWLWRGALLSLLLILAGGLSLSIAIGLGWNDPGPALGPDWRVPDPITLQVVPPRKSAVHLLEHPVRSFTFEAVASSSGFAGFDSYGLVFRAQGTDRFSVFAVGVDGYVAVLQIEGEIETPLLDWQPFPHINRGESANRLRVSCAEDTCHFWINDEHVTFIPDEAVPSGDLGFWVHSSNERQMLATYTLVAVWEQ